jgi:murein DD-endopeptidase MepM/ murein hydrolase activator NlpD
MDRPAVATQPSSDQPIAADAFQPITPRALDRVEAAFPDPMAAWELPHYAGRLDGRADLVDAVAPSVVRFRPRPGQTGISTLAAVSVRFTVPMDHASTSQAFTASVAGSRIEGRYWWAEGDTVLVLVPTRSMPFGARVTLSVTGAARSAAGVSLATGESAVFTVAAKPAATTATSGPRPSTMASAWRWPLIGPITQYFGQSLTKYGYHYGIDIDGETGDPVRAARSGRVVVAGHYDQCGGLEVHIDHGDGLVSWYRHLSSVNVRVGSWVSGGALIGRVGATGCALGSHLHFAIRRGSTFVDPLIYLPRR